MTRPDLRQGQRQTEGVLAGHYRQGRVFKTPLTAYKELAPSDWVRDDLPDLLWPILIAYEAGEDVVAVFAELQHAILASIPSDEFTGGAGFDGRLTSLEAVDPVHRPAVVDVCRRLDIDRTFPAEVVALATLYETLPGAWLLADPWPDPAIAPEDVATSLARAIVAAVTDNNELVKAPVVRWQISAGRMSMPPQHEREILDFPADTANRGPAGASIRSSFLVTKGLTQQPEVSAARDNWATSFWGQNWHRTDCWPEEGGPDDDPDTSDEEPDAPLPPAGELAVEDDTDPEDVTEVADLSGPAVERAIGLFNMFLNVVLDPSITVDLHHPEKYEVLTGLISRAARATIRTLHHPDLWSGEHGMTTMRVLAETEIVIRWMEHSGDDAIYAKFQDYGRGKRKLMRRHFENLRATFDNPPDFFNDVSASYERTTGGAWSEEFQDVSIERTFANRDLRQMAADVGLDDMYRHVFQPASGVSHGEWWAIEDYAMQRCMNPLHRFHLLPSFDLEYPITVDFPKVLHEHLRQCAIAALDQLVPRGERGDQASENQL